MAITDVNAVLDLMYNENIIHTYRDHPYGSFELISLQNCKKTVWYTLNQLCNEWTCKGQVKELSFCIWVILLPTVTWLPTAHCCSFHHLLLYEKVTDNSTYKSYRTFWVVNCKIFVTIINVYSDAIIETLTTAGIPWIATHFITNRTKGCNLVCKLTATTFDTANSRIAITIRGTYTGVPSFETIEKKYIIQYIYII